MPFKVSKGLSFNYLVNFGPLLVRNLPISSQNNKSGNTYGRDTHTDTRTNNIYTYTYIGGHIVAIPLLNFHNIS